jgi:hypothetical protein
VPLFPTFQSIFSTNPSVHRRKVRTTCGCEYQGRDKLGGWTTHTKTRRREGIRREIQLSVHFGKRPRNHDRKRSRRQQSHLIRRRCIGSQNPMANQQYCHMTCRCRIQPDRHCNWRAPPERLRLCIAPDHRCRGRHLDAPL